MNPTGSSIPTPPERAEILGIPLAVSNYEQVMDWMDAMVAAGERGYVTAAAVNLVMHAREDAATMDGGAGGDARGAGRAAAGVGAARARACRGDARVRAGPDGDVLRARGSARARRCTCTVGAGIQSAELLASGCASATRGCRSWAAQAPPFTPLTLEEEQATAARRSTPPGRRSSGSGPASPSRSCGWRGCGTACRRRCWSGSGAAFDFHAGTRQRRRRRGCGATGSSGHTG